MSLGLLLFWKRASVLAFTWSLFLLKVGLFCLNLLSRTFEKP